MWLWWGVHGHGALVQQLARMQGVVFHTATLRSCILRAPLSGTCMKTMLHAGSTHSRPSHGEGFAQYPSLNELYTRSCEQGLPRGKPRHEWPSISAT